MLTLFTLIWSRGFVVATLKLGRANKPNTHKLAVASSFFALLALFSSAQAHAGAKEQAYRIHNRLTGQPPSEQVLTQMTTLIESGDTEGAARVAMEDESFYSVVLKNWITPWTNRDFNVFQPLNDYTATVIGIIRDDIDFRTILTGDILYVADPSFNLPNYSMANNSHYEAIDSNHISLKQSLIKTTQSATYALPAAATAGVLTTRAAAKAFFYAGTNRAMFRYTFINHMCTDLDALKDTSRVPDRIRQDVSRSPGGDSRIFINSCSGCHAAMDPMAQAFAYYNYAYDSENDPSGENGQLAYNAEGQLDATTGTRVVAKYHINSNNFKPGFVTPNDSWQNYWRAGINSRLGWDANLLGEGTGAKSLGEELANSHTFASCQVKKVFNTVCLRDPQDQADRDMAAQITAQFKASGYQLKQVFAATANYCKGN